MLQLFVPKLLEKETFKQSPHKLKWNWKRNKEKKQKKCLQDVMEASKDGEWGIQGEMVKGRRLGWWAGSEEIIKSKPV